MQRTTSYSMLGRRLLTATRGFCTSTLKSGGNGKILASVLIERLPVVIPKIDPVVYAFQEFSNFGCELGSDGDNNIDENTLKLSSKNLMPGEKEIIKLTLHQLHGSLKQIRLMI